MNKTILKGRLTKDVELKQTKGAEPKNYANFSIAVNRFKKDESDFINCIAWGKTAEFISKYFNKGMEILVDGRLQVDTVDTDGVKHTFVKVVVEQAEFCGSKGSGNVSNDNGQASEDDIGDCPF